MGSCEVSLTHSLMSWFWVCQRFLPLQPLLFFCLCLQDILLSLFIFYIKYTSHDNIVCMIKDHKLGLKTVKSARILLCCWEPCRTLWGDWRITAAWRHMDTREAGSAALLKREIWCILTLKARKLDEQHPNLLGDTSVRTVQHVLHDDLRYKKVRGQKKLLIHGSRKGGFCLSRNIKTGTWRDRRGCCGLTKPHSEWVTSGQSVWQESDLDPFSVNRITAAARHPQQLMVWGSFRCGGLEELGYASKCDCD